MPKKRHRVNEKLYFLCGAPYVCAYCGDAADNIDHCVPSSFVSGNIALTMRYHFVKVHSCSECNLMAGAQVDATFIERRRRIAKAVRKRYGKELQTGHWPQDELDDLGYALRSSIEVAQAVADRVRQRLRRLDNPLPPDGVPDDLFIAPSVVTQTPPDAA